ncbi:hypothetical protein [Mangrovicoccus algicola]|uniref:Lipoprotein n=1 Tax=Mangrovicoccus algicola TaxID=2771008 RepID=A0A8J6Z8B2_9RHOB|nr:hypothetical protein [Mangrovicoccus algicola]MBE3637676.1 hypothetical protein [Mangrovicoccus algicola]
MRAAALAASLAILALSACDTPSPAAGGSVYKAMNGRRVVPLREPAGAFEVLALPGDAGPQFFCAAADYAYTMRGARPVDRVVIVRSAGDSLTHPGTRGVAFRIMSRDEAPPLDGVYLNPRKQGEAATIGHARQLCRRPVSWFGDD